LDRLDRWIRENNRNGIFDDWNPKDSCR